MSIYIIYIMGYSSFLDVRKNLGFCVGSLQRSETKASQIILLIVRNGSKSDPLSYRSGVCLGFSCSPVCGLPFKFHR